MKKYFMTVCAAVALLSCAKEINAPITTEGPANMEEQEIQPLVFDFQINHASLDGPGTKAVKTGWEAGDVVYVFFSGIAAPKHVELTYDGSAWTSKQITTGKTEGSIGLTDGGTMTAVYLPFGNDAVVKSENSSFSFEQTIFSYYLSCVNAPYTISGDTVSGTLDMSVPDGFVQFFINDNSASAGIAALSATYVTPICLSTISADITTISHISLPEGSAMPGYVYDKENKTGTEEKGYLFSGILNSDARNAMMDYSFGLVTGISSKEASKTATIYTSSSTKRAINISGLSWNNRSLQLVDLGLSVKWANMNLGASSPNEVGNYYAWGEVTTKNIFTYDSYVFENGAYNLITKYCPSSKPEYWDGVGSPDDKNVLEPIDDAAHVWIGGSWRMPTQEEIKELQDNCTFVWTTNYEETGKRGYIVSSNKPGYEANSVFFPATGFCFSTTIGYLVDTYVGFWSSSLLLEYPSEASIFHDTSSSDTHHRDYGFVIRPVGN